MTPPEAPVVQAQRLAREGRAGEASEVLRALITEECPGLGPVEVRVSTDRYSLNSLNGTVTAGSADRYFFKLHVEEGEERTVEEYYRAKLLEEAGWPVEVPVHASTAPGRQFLLYRWSDDERLADACLAVERGNRSTGEAAALIAEQEALDAIIGAQIIASLHQRQDGSSQLTPSEREPIHQLFHHRLVDHGSGDALGGRARSFYMGQSTELPDGELAFDDLARCRWRLNGVATSDSFMALLDESRVTLHPQRLARHGLVTAHGDDHNANVWRGAGGLRLFDPAFAGSEIPALLATVKATFHNAWAHPFWLYDPGTADTSFQVDVTRRHDEIRVETDWQPGPLREGLLASKTTHVWRPLLRSLRQVGLLPDDWRRIVRCALFCCPALVLSLRARGPKANALGLAIATTLGSESSEGRSFVDDWLDAIAS